MLLDALAFALLDHRRHLIDVEHAVVVGVGGGKALGPRALDLFGGGSAVAVAIVVRQALVHPVHLMLEPGPGGAVALAEIGEGDAGDDAGDDQGGGGEQNESASFHADLIDWRTNGVASCIVHSSV